MESLKILKYTLLFSAFVLITSGCIKSPDFSDIPEIGYIGASKTAMIQSSLNQDSIEIVLSFQDGDGDIGYGESESRLNLFVIDKRTNTPYTEFKVPAIPEKGANNGVEGKIYLTLFSTCCIFDDGTPPCMTSINTQINELQLDIYMLDRADNKSNVITTEPINLLCR